MLLTREQIIDGCRSGVIIIDPFDYNSVNSSSYDVRIGEHFWYENPVDTKSRQQLALYNPHNETSIRSVWKKARAAKTVELMQLKSVPDVDLSGFSGDDKLIIIPPRSMILAHTEEFIGSNCNFIIPEMHSRSTTVRNFLDVCGSGGWGDHGYCNRWTMEITNTSKYHAVVIKVGTKIAQISFMQTAATSMYQDISGNYDPFRSLETKKANWKPEMMLPNPNGFNN